MGVGLPALDMLTRWESVSFQHRTKDKGKGFKAPGIRGRNCRNAAGIYVSRVAGKRRAPGKQSKAPPFTHFSMVTLELSFSVG